MAKVTTQNILLNDDCSQCFVQTCFCHGSESHKVRGYGQKTRERSKQKIIMLTLAKTCNLRAENNLLILLLPALCWIHVLTLRMSFPIFKESGPFKSKGVKTKHAAAFDVGQSWSWAGRLICWTGTEWTSTLKKPTTTKITSNMRWLQIRTDLLMDRRWRWWWGWWGHYNSKYSWWGHITNINSKNIILTTNGN